LLFESVPIENKSKGYDMFIFAFLIKNFRSFDSLWGFPNSTVNVIVGPNNCGKSTIMRALAYVLDPTINYRQPGLLSRFDFHLSNILQPIEITVWLKPAIHSDENGITIYDDSEKVKCAFFDKLTAWKVETQERNTTGVNEIHPVNLSALTIEPMQRPEDVPPHERLLAIHLRSTWNNDIETTETEVEIIDETGKKISPLNNQHKELLGFKMVGGRRNPVYELSLSRQSLLSKMINDDEVNLALRELLIQLDNGKNQLLDKPSINVLLQRLSGLIAPELMGALVNNLGSEFSLTFLGSDLWRLRGATTIATNMAMGPDSKFSLPLEYQGDGAQNLILITHLIDLIREPKDNDIVVLEEPEQNLEPSLARWVFGELCSLTQKQTQQFGQLFVTTHAPALVGELKGAESLLIFSDNLYSPENPQEANVLKPKRWQLISARNLSPDSRKKLDQDREKYIPALFSRQALIVEGSSEMGFLPVAFHHFSEGRPGQNPYHLGLEIVNGESRDKLFKHAKILRSYGKRCHLLFDYDIDVSEDIDNECRSRFNGQVDFVTCWPKQNLLPFTNGCDLEVILTHYIPSDILFEAIKIAYSDSGHPLEERNWRNACNKILDREIVNRFPNVFGDFNLNEFDLHSLVDENIQRAFLFTLLHGPHDCKATKDMRMIAEYLAEKQAIPMIFDDLRKKVLQTITIPMEVNHNAPYLAAR
jgi:energy-coupling factor transporter ATP-binding protein EcfA2